MKSRDLDDLAMWILLIISIPFMLIVMGLSKIYEIISKKNRG